MCAIAGSPERARVDLFLETMKHRAPDGFGAVTDGGYTIGMGRLAILDKKAPFPITRDNLVLTFNGEIYNYIELREELKKMGHSFQTESDSEVLLAAFQEWGVRMFDHLNGMFAFAILDTSSLQITLGRDLAGEKPLYYRKGDSFEFASEAKCFKCDCEELPPAHYAVYDIKQNDLQVHRWWYPRVFEINPKTAVEELENLLEDAVKLRLRSDVPVGLYFSGGIDSTLISTFPGVKQMFTYEYGKKEDFAEVFPTITWHLDYPIRSFSAFGLWKLAQSARDNGVRVVLSGEGADELFGGYVRYVGNEFNRVAQKKFPSYKALFPHRDMMWEEFNGNMRELLRMGDRMASAWGIENRCPFLDRRVVEFALNLPPELKIKGFDTKVILRKILKKRKPDYQFAEKHGLFCPVNKWLGFEGEFSKDQYLNAQNEILQNLGLVPKA